MKISLTRRRPLRLTALLLTLCLCAGAVGMSQSKVPTVGADQTSDLKSQIAALEEKKEQAQQEAAALQDDIDAQEEVQANLQTQIDAVQEQVDLYQAQIDSLDTQIAAQNEKIDSLNTQLAQAQAQMEQTKETFHERMRAIYLEGNTSTLELLLGAESYADFLTRSQYVNSLADSDREMLNQLVALQEQIESNKAELESTKSALESNQAQVSAAKAEQDAKIAELETLQGQSESTQQALENDQEDLEQTAEKYQDQIDACNKEIEAIAKANAAKYGSTINGSDSSGAAVTNDSSYLWPCASHTISSGYGYRWGSMHRGIDISAAYGTAIYAAKSGVVVVSMMGYSGSGFGGYGNVIMLQHADGTYTLYAHCSQRYVSVGQTVSQGQTIAAVGSTGQSNGNHLHFEIRMGVSSSTSVNPLSYL